MGFQRAATESLGFSFVIFLTTASLWSHELTEHLKSTLMAGVISQTLQRGQDKWREKCPFRKNFTWNVLLVDTARVIIYTHAQVLDANQLTVVIVSFLHKRTEEKKKT